MFLGITFWLSTLLAGLLTYWWRKLKANSRYWEKRGMAQTDPWMFFGDTIWNTFQVENIGVTYLELYNRFPDEPLVGFFSFAKPTVLVKDPELIEQVLVKDFSSYVDHGFLTDDQSNPREVSLFTLTGNKWRALRNKMTPTFTTGKLRGMTSYMTDASRNALDYLESLNVSPEAEVDVRDFFVVYATEILGSCVFGIDTKELGKPGSKFREMGEKVVKVTPMGFLRMMFLFTFPKLARKLNLSFNDLEVIDYYEKIVVETLEQRRKTGEERNDFVQLLLQLQEKGKLEMFAKEKDADDDYLDTRELHTTETFELTDTLIVSQALSFLTAGFEAVSLVMMYCCFELAQNEEVQERLREEVREKLAQHGSMTYQAIKEMTYLEQCLQETLRKYPVAQALFRSCTKDTTLGGIPIEGTTPVMISVLGLHYDPQHYPDPQVFDPDRFHPSASRTPFTYLPFGDGPRVCIGMRFALLEMKVAVAALVNEYDLKLSPKVKLPLQYRTNSFMLTPTEKILLQMTKL